MAKMRAMIVPEPHGGLRLVERDLPEPGHHEVRIRVHACGVCHSDTVTVEGAFPGITYPRIPGHEVIGVIDALGPDVDGFAVGARGVGVGWFARLVRLLRQLPARRHFRLRERAWRLPACPRDGGYATHMLALASAVVRLPDGLDAVESAPLLLRRHHHLQRFAQQRSAAPAIWWPCMASAVSAISAYSSLPVRAFARSRSTEGATRKPSCAPSGAHDYIDSNTQDPAKALLAMGGAKAILATVTNADAMQAISGGLGVNGTMMVIGAVGPLTVDSLGLMLYKRSFGAEAGTPAPPADAEVDTLHVRPARTPSPR